MSNTVCNTVTGAVSSRVRRIVQTRPDQIVLSVSCGVSGSNRIRSNGYLPAGIGFGVGR